MIHFFGNTNKKVYAVQSNTELSQEDIKKLIWLFGNAQKINQASLDAFFIGPRASMITPWSTNAVEITQNMCIEGISRIEEFTATTEDFDDYDHMLLVKHNGLHQDSFKINIAPEPILSIEDIALLNLLIIYFS